MNSEIEKIRLMIIAQVDKNAFVLGHFNARNQPNAF